MRIRRDKRRRCGSEVAMKIQNRVIGSSLAAVLLIGAMVALPAAAKPVPKLPTIDEKRLEALWAELEKDDADATRALLKLSAMPKEATAFLGQKLRPLKIDAAQVTALLEQLGSDNEAAWKKAFTELEYFD